MTDKPLTKDEAIALLREAIQSATRADVGHVTVHHSPRHDTARLVECKLCDAIARTATLAEEKCERCGGISDAAIDGYTKVAIAAVEAATNLKGAHHACGIRPEPTP